jgi:hypothetical protein
MLQNYYTDQNGHHRMKMDSHKSICSLITEKNDEKRKEEEKNGIPKTIRDQTLALANNSDTIKKN